MVSLQSLFDQSEVILADGAMGTMLFASGLQHGGSPELWNVEHPERVAAVHRAYLEAGSRLLLTNTFGGNRMRLTLHGLEGRVAELNRAAAVNLREVVAASGVTALVAGDIGPSGGVMAPYGEMAYEDAVAAFTEQAAALVEGGVDLVWIETMADLEEVRAAVEGVRQASQEIPLLTSMTFDTRGRTMMGVTPEQAVQALVSFGAQAVGGNCGNGTEEIIGVIQKMHAADPGATLIAKANAGIPRLVNRQPVYPASPADMAEYALKAYDAGARIIGACCGSTPQHIQAIAAALAAATAGHRQAA
jgi:5-methyltetrahydrofolate--homocysteine methyltransferase